MISHAHRIAINEQEKATGAGRRCAGAGTKVAKGSFVEVWEVGERFLLDDGQSFSGAELLHAAVPRDHLRQLVGAHAAREGLALDADNPHFSVTPLRRRVAGHERGAGLRVLIFGPSPIRAISPVPGAKKGQSVPHRAPLQGGESGEASEPPHSLGRHRVEEVRAGGVAQVHPAPQREPLAAGVGDGVAEPRVAQELRVGLGEVVAAVAGLLDGP